MAWKGTAVVAEVGWANGLAAIRSLGRHGLRVIGVDNRPYALGFRSRYAEPRLAPDPIDDADGYIAAFSAIAAETEGLLPIFPTHDEHLNTLSRRAGELDGRYRFPFPSWDVLESIQSKRHQLDTAESIGFPIPRTFHPRTAEEAQAAGADLGFPLIVKPAANVGFRRTHKVQLFRCENAAELTRAYEEAAPFEPMVQELIPGGPEEMYTLGSYLSADGEALGLFSGRKVRQTRGFTGVARVAEAVWVDEVVEGGLALLRALRFHGISQVETIRDPRDGKFKLIEVNPRLWLWHGLAAACGVDLPWIAYRDLIGEPLPPVLSHKSGKRWAVTLMGGAPHAVQRRPYVDAIFARDDPKPAAVHFARYTLHAVRKLTGAKNG
ncbi:MAG: D-aspartate ligase [Gaiellaceae bacterium]|nr:D-aspartate ligase [Gaiellaceae bacterium]